MEEAETDDISAAAAKIEDGLDAFFNSKALYQSWMKEKLDDITAENFFKYTLCRVKNNTSEHKWNHKRLDDLMGKWAANAASLGRNKWALYNTMTEWATHTDGSKSPASTRRLNEGIIAKAIPQLENI